MVVVRRVRDGMSKGTGYIEGDDDDCETNPCDVATGAMTL